MNFGIIGCGQHVAKVMIKAFAETHCANVVALATRSTEKAQKLHSFLPNCTIYSDYESLLQDSNIDAVYVAIPNHLHAQISMKALHAGKHVLCEKPLTLTYKEALEVHEAATSSKRTLCEAFMYRFHPQHAVVQQVIEKGDIGDIRLIESHFHYFLNDPNNIRLNSKTGGGSLLDVGCYLIDSARFLLQNEPVMTSANWKVNNNTKVDEFTCFQLLFDNDTVAHCSCSCKMERANNYTIYGTRGLIRATSAFHTPRNKIPIIELTRNEKRPEIIRANSANHYSIMIDKFVGLLQGKTINKSCFSSGLENMRIIDAVRDAAITKTSVEIRKVGT